MSDFELDLRTAVESAANRPDVLAAVGRIYADVAADIAARKPVCDLSGRCCKFDDYGHRLYVSTLELAAFIAALAPAQKTTNDNPGGCPFQIGRLCGVHTIRPFGCRMFFCDTTATDWQQQMYERFHARLKSLHDELSVPYFYVEWRQALTSLQLPRVAISPAAV